MSDSVPPQRRQPTRLPHPWDSPGKNTGVGCHFLLQLWKHLQTLCRPQVMSTHCGHITHNQQAQQPGLKMLNDYHCWHLHLNSELLQAARHASPLLSCSCLNSCLVHCSVTPAPWLLSRRSPPGSSHLPSWQFDTNKPPLRTCSEHSYTKCLFWNLSICTSLTGDFYTFRDTEYIANDYLLKPPIFGTF